MFSALAPIDSKLAGSFCRGSFPRLRGGGEDGSLLPSTLDTADIAGVSMALVCSMVSADSMCAIQIQHHHAATLSTLDGCEKHHQSLKQLRKERNKGTKQCGSGLLV